MTDQELADLYWAAHAQFGPFDVDVYSFIDSMQEEVDEPVIVETEQTHGD